jgi:hypothetical protein
MRNLLALQTTQWRYGLAPFLVSGALLASPASAAPCAVGPESSNRTDADTPAAPADGALGRLLFGEAFGSNSGLKLGGWVEGGFVMNDHIHRSEGAGNTPVALGRDTGFQLNQATVFFQKDIRTNVIPRVTPTPAPMPQDYSFGWRAQALYGRDGQVFQTYGWDSRWPVNKPGNYDAAEAQENRQLFLVVPELYLQGYLPWYKGMSFLFGTFMSPCGREIGMNPAQTPNFFYSHTYTLESEPVSQSGLLWDALLVDHKGFGLLSVEAGITNGWSNLTRNNKNPTYDLILHYRTMDMRTWVDLVTITGNGAANSDMVGFPQDTGDRWFGDRVNAPTTRVISPRAQNRSEAALDLYREFTGRFKAVLEFTYGKMQGDGQADTVDIVTGPGFTGATWGSINFEAQYQLTRNLSAAFRAETFHDPDGFILFPNASAKGNMNEVTTGVQWQALKALMVRPEVRCDWQSRNGGDHAFAGGTKDKQVTFMADAIYRF